MREDRGLTLRDISEISRSIALIEGNRRLIIFPSRLHEIETKGRRPNIYAIYILSFVYKITPEKLIGLFV